MKILLDISDNKAAFFFELMKNFSFVKKAHPLTSANELFLKELSEAVEEVNKIKSGKMKPKNMKAFLDEL